MECGTVGKYVIRVHGAIHACISTSRGGRQGDVRAIIADGAATSTYTSGKIISMK